jgi:NADPH-dependent 2,4-dienoyl-CoA reductase/sulfur reductase-like enzyme
VRIVFPEAGIGARLFPADMAESVNELYRGHGVEVLPGELVSAVERDGRFSVQLESGTVLEADGVVAGFGILPVTELAEAAGLPVEDGIRVDEYGRTGDTGDVYAAGDVARFPAAALGTEIRVEHEDHANSHGRAVGANMAGADQPYRHQPFFYSDLFELGYEAVGEVDSRKQTTAEWKEPFRKGVVAYLDDGGRPRGFLLVDTWGKVDAATELIAAAEPLEPGALASLAG